MGHSDAVEYIASMLEAIQVLYNQASAVADEHGVPFDLTLNQGAYYDQRVEYAPKWVSSSSNC